MSQEYLIEMYRLALFDYHCATDDDGRHCALCDMSRLQLFASEIYGFDFADELPELAKSQIC